MIRRPPRSTQSRSSAASDVYKRQVLDFTTGPRQGPPRSFFYCARFPGSGRSAPHHERHMMVPAIPASPFVVIQAELFLELVVVLFDFPPALDDPYQPAQLSLI